MKKLVIVEGIDGTGKSTFIKKNFNKKEWKIIHLPGYFDYNKNFYKLFKKGKLKDYQYTFQIFAEHLQVLWMLNEIDKNIVLDRSFISFLVYQADEINNFDIYNLVDEFYDLLGKFLFSYEIEIYYFDNVYKNKQKDFPEKNNDKQLLLLRYENILEYIKENYKQIKIYKNMELF